LAIDADIDERTIRRYLDGTSINPDKRSVIAVCMALKLPPDITEKVLTQARISLVQGDKDDEGLLSVITCMRGKSIHKINDYLEKIGVAPLTKEKL